MNLTYKRFLTTELPALLRNLEGDQAPNFGLMTAHHMVEHLIWVTKFLPKRKGEPSAELSKSQQYFRKFVDAGCPSKYKPEEGKTKADLQKLRSPDIATAIQSLEQATTQFYELFEANPDHKTYNELMGEFTMDEVEMFLYQHGQWHAYQFGLVEEFAAAAV